MFSLKVKVLLVSRFHEAMRPFLFNVNFDAVMDVILQTWRQLCNCLKSSKKLSALLTFPEMAGLLWVKQMWTSLVVHISSILQNKFFARYANWEYCRQWLKFFIFNFQIVQTLRATVLREALNFQFKISKKILQLCLLLRRNNSSC